MVLNFKEVSLFILFILVNTGYNLMVNNTGLAK